MELQISEIQRDKKTKQVALLSTVGLNTAIIILLMLIGMAWGAPGPPGPGSYGIEVNFGLDNSGTGDIQPKDPVGTEHVTPQEPEKQEEKPVEQEQHEQPSEPVKSTTDQKLVTSEDNEAVAVKDKKETSKTLPVATTEKKDKKDENKDKEEQHKVNTQAVYNPTNTKTEGGKEGKPGNHGDDKNAVGDKGNPEGKLDAKSLYGTPGGGGGGGGSNLEIYGWNWDKIPDPAVPNNEQQGRIVFEIFVDENGDIHHYNVVERSVSPEAEKAFRQAIEKLTFSKKPGAQVPPLSKGRITFVVTSK